MDFNSDTWHRLRKWAEGELKKARERNDSVQLSEADTAAIRGEIKFIKRFLDLPNQAAREVVTAPDE